MSVESTIATLIQRGYVAEIGHDPGPGQAILYGTTVRFLEQMGIDSLQDLPPLAEFVPDPSVVEALERGLHLRIDDAPVTDDEGADPSTGASTGTTRSSSEIIAGVDAETEMRAEAVLDENVVDLDSNPE